MIIAENEKWKSLRYLSYTFIIQSTRSLLYPLIEITTSINWIGIQAILCKLNGYLTPTTGVIDKIRNVCRVYIIWHSAQWYRANQY